MKKYNEKFIILNGVKNLKEYGYPEVDEKNILVDPIYSRFFLSMLEDNKGNGFDVEIENIKSKINTEGFNA